MWAGYAINNYPDWLWADINRQCPTFLGSKEQGPMENYSHLYVYSSHKGFKRIAVVTIHLRAVDYILHIGLQITPTQFPFLRYPTQLGPHLVVLLPFCVKFYSSVVGYE